MYGKITTLTTAILAVFVQTRLINKIESVQKRFLRVLAFKTNKTDVSLEQLANEFRVARK
ncbi:Reverse transcriptase domain-containing protein [Aphis craccivora]|uniref:Reverse transcriptase domain-containing protein n=1 Tax=Aphis craccivora TaxID=307492 RepID=A0A6G0ZAL0_APHCR|nr:Reverse transcriptase domain-containing protein [Aphis craccivora]